MFFVFIILMIYQLCMIMLIFILIFYLDFNIIDLFHVDFVLECFLFIISSGLFHFINLLFFFINWFLFVQFLTIVIIFYISKQMSLEFFNGLDIFELLKYMYTIDQCFELIYVHSLNLEVLNYLLLVFYFLTSI